ncbi:hypothetical protein AB4037_17845 [Labrys sp. KB_33_2]|uniref:hypothetical protein n=1 Tax=Labrys sp. KB_33_2 TaxID=3237479 RepID=UPI003F9287EA
MSILSYSLVVGLAFGLAGCAMEQTIRQENAAAEQRCASRGLHPAKVNTPEQMNYIDCIGVERARIRKANGTAECIGSGFQAGTPAMAQCEASRAKARSDQIVADFNADKAQMAR